jgi:hypothetical protein
MKLALSREVVKEEATWATWGEIELQIDGGLTG